MKKKILTGLLAFVFVFSGVAKGASFNDLKKDHEIDKKNKQVKIIEKFQKKSEKSGKELKINWNE